MTHHYISFQLGFHLSFQYFPSGETSDLFSTQCFEGTYIALPAEDGCQHFQLRSIWKISFSYLIQIFILQSDFTLLFSSAFFDLILLSSARYKSFYDIIINL